jgi:hypothetical protein
VVLVVGWDTTVLVELVGAAADEVVASELDDVSVGVPVTPAQPASNRPAATAIRGFRMISHWRMS